MEIKEILTMQKQVKAKLMSAVALLLVSAILLSTSTYAWLVLSTAPEVSEMKTTAGANGALAIALQSTKAESGMHDRAEITNGVGDTGSNTTWGGLVDLANYYGLEKISLSPARLNLGGSSVVIDKPLSIPQFGIDGRVSALTPMGTVYYSADGADGTAGTFVEGFNYGVNIVGKRDDLNGAGASITRTMKRQWLIDTSTAKISTMRAEMLEELQQVILDNSTGIAKLLELYLSVATGSVKVTERDYNTVKSLTDVFQGLMGDAVVALRYALLACCAADVTTYQPGKDGEAALSAVYAKYNKLPLQSKADEATGELSESIESIARANQAGQTDRALLAAYQAIVDAVTSVSDAQTRIGLAQTNLAASNKGSDNGKLAAACAALITVDNMYIGPRGNAEERIRITADLQQAASVFRGPANATHTDLDLYAVKESGLFYTMALVLGDYKALVDYVYTESRRVNGKKVNVECEKLIDLYATTADNCEGFSSFVHTGSLQSAYDAAAPLRVDGTVTYTMDVSTHLNAYGYAVDLAFRSSAGGKLLLQQEPAARVTNGASDSAADRLPEQQNIQGGGSTMTFTVADDMTEAQARALVQRVYVIFMNTDTGAILGLAAADEGSIEVKTNTNATTQKDTREVSATLALYSRNIVDGVLTKGATLPEQQITTLAPDTPAYITALVYLDGDAVTGGEMSADTTQSLFGSLNLQFCGDQELTVMPYDGLLAGE